MRFLAHCMLVPLALLLPLSAGAVDGTDGGSAGPEAEATDLTARPDTLDPLVPPYSEAWRWRRVSPVDGQRVADVAVHPVDPDRIAAVSEAGVVWVSRDGGRTWQAVLGSRDEALGTLSSDEDILLDVDARLGEILDSADTEIDEDLGEDEVSDVIQEAASQGTDELFTDVEADPGFTVRSEEVGERLEPRLAWLEDVLFASLDGQVYMSRNDGRSWGSILDVHAWDMARLPSVWVALTEDGGRVALDPRAWFDVVDGTEGTPLHGAATTIEVLLASSDTGLWGTRDGERWARWGDLREPVRAVASHPEVPELVWVVTDRGLLRSDDRGLTFGEPVLRDESLTDVVAPLPGRVVVARSGSLLESLDGGRTWAVMTSGLEGVSGGHLVARPDGGLLLAAADGLWSLRRLGGGDVEERERWLRLDALLGASLSRSGVRRDFDARTRRWTAAAVPVFSLEGYYVPDEGLDWSQSLGTEANRDGGWRVMGRLTWTPRVRRANTGEIEDAVELGVIVVDDEPLIVADNDDYVVAARMDKVLATYQAELAATVTDLYRTHAELVAERHAMSGERLQRRVLHELAIDEIEARLDALSDGAVHRWRTTLAPDPEP